MAQGKSSAIDKPVNTPAQSAYARIRARKSQAPIASRSATTGSVEGDVRNAAPAITPPAHASRSENRLRSHARAKYKQITTKASPDNAPSNDPLVSAQKFTGNSAAPIPAQTPVVLPIWNASAREGNRAQAIEPMSELKTSCASSPACPVPKSPKTQLSSSG